jgi:hypothetical protein
MTTSKHELRSSIIAQGSWKRVDRTKPTNLQITIGVDEKIGWLEVTVDEVC